MRKAFAILMAMAMLILTMSSVAAQTTEPVDPNPECTYFEETGHNLCAEFEEFWNANGGLAIFGMPLTEAFEEENPDTGEVYLVQYFERERFELHPENAGTVYEVLLGRLGAQILELQGRNWFEFEQADPSEPHYFAETGHAIAPEFWEYWSSHGLEYGDPGVSMRESLLLFGYPISGPMMETNMDGDTVLTQWFERAVFEFHPDNDEANQVLLRRLGAELLELTQPEPEPEFEVVAEGLDNPRHLDMGMDDMLLVAEAGRGGDECVTGEGPEGPTESCFGETGAITEVFSGEEVASGLPSNAGPDGNFASGPHSVSVAADGTIYVVIGEPTGETTLEGFWQLWSIATDGTTTMVADLLAYEQENNPDELPDLPEMEPGIHSNPYAVLATDDGVYVVDAGGNDVLKVAEDGTISTYAVLPMGEAEAPDFLGLPPGTMIPVQPVPTSITEGPDGALYVGQLTGFPFPVGGASVYRLEDVDGDGDVLEEGEMTVYADGLTAIVDLEFGPDGMLYVVELAEEGLLALEMGDPNDPALGAIVRVDGEGNGTVVTSAGLVAPTGIEIAEDGTIYVSNMGIFAGAGQVVQLDAMAAGPEMPFEVVAEGLDNPRHLNVGMDGGLYVAESGSGGDECITVGEGEQAQEICTGPTSAVSIVTDEEGVVEVLSELPSQAGPDGSFATGTADAIVDGDGIIWAVTGGAGDPDVPADDILAGFSKLVMGAPGGDWTVVADLGEYEATVNPGGEQDDPVTGEPGINSNPYALTMHEDHLYVIDAGGNDLLKVTQEGEISTFAVFPRQELEMPDGSTVMVDAVPTSITMGPDGAFYVGELGGETGGAPSAHSRIWRVMDENGDGDAMDEGETTVEMTGFFSIIDIDFAEDGTLYVLQIFSLTPPADPNAPPAGALIRVAEDGTETLLASEGLVFPAGLEVMEDGIYVSNFGTFAGAGQIVRVDP